MKTGDIHLERPGKATREITRNLRGESERKPGVAHDTFAEKQNTLIERTESTLMVRQGLNS